MHPIGIVMCFKIVSVLILFNPVSVSAAMPEEVLLKEDRAFNRLAESHGVQAAFAFYMADEAVLLNSGMQSIKGNRAIMKSFNGLPAGYMLSWEPVEAALAASGDLGYTWGRFKARIPQDQGDPLVRHGKYTTVWRKQINGLWKVILSMGNTNPEPAVE
jgi:ketosteroid isomerase-like protein